MGEATYILDSNVYIEAYQRYYAFDLVPGFWEFLKQRAAEGKIVSIDRVKDELEKGKDDLADWACFECGDSFAKCDDDDVIASYKAVIDWVENQAQFTEAAKSEFASAADGWLVSYAMARGC